MKSGQRIEDKLIGPGDNDYGRKDIVREPIPEITQKIWKSFQNKIYNDNVSKEAVLRHLKQLKAEMGRKMAKYKDVQVEANYQEGIKAAMMMIDNKIKKVKEL